MENDENAVLNDADETIEVEVEEEAPEPKAEKPKRTPEEELEHLEGRRNRLLKKLGRVDPTPPKPAPPPSELDETQLELLDFKGINEQDDIDVIQKVMKNTGQTLRQALKDDYVVNKLAALKADRDLKAATPSSTKRGSAGHVDDFDKAYDKFERTGELPKDFELRSRIVDAKERKEGNQSPPWRK